MTDIARRLEAEHRRVNSALNEVSTHWNRPGMARAVADLSETVDHAERLLPTFTAEEEDQGHAFKVRVGGLRALLILGHKEMARTMQFALAEGGRRRASEDTAIPDLATIFLPDTIVSCADCQESLYKVTRRATTADLVMDDGTILQPLNTTILQRDAWKLLACPKCGGRVYKAGKVHTVQGGWQ